MCTAHVANITSKRIQMKILYKVKCGESFYAIPLISSDISSPRSA